MLLRPEAHFCISSRRSGSQPQLSHSTASLGAHLGLLPQPLLHHPGKLRRDVDSLETASLTRVLSRTMAEAVGLAASVIGIIDLSAKVAVLCLQYSTAVGHARADITRLRSRLDDLGTTLQGVQRLLDNRNHQALATSRKLADSLDGCTSELVQLQSRLAPGKARKAMRRFGLRALKWPFDSKELSDIVSNLERYEQTITLGLQIDQT